MNTLASLKRYLKEGSVIKMTFSCYPNNNRIDKKREVVKIQSNGVYFIDPEDPDADKLRKSKRGSFLSFPKASLLEITEKGFKIFSAGKRPLTIEEKKIMDNKPVDEKQFEMDMKTDTNIMYHRWKTYFINCNAEYLRGYIKERGMRYDFNSKMVWDDNVKGKVELEYEFVK